MYIHVLIFLYLYIYIYIYIEIYIYRYSSYGTSCLHCRRLHRISETEIYQCVTYRSLLQRLAQQWGKPVGGGREGLWARRGIN